MAVKRMGMKRWLWCLMGLLLLGGCCGKPKIVQRPVLDKGDGAAARPPSAVAAPTTETGTVAAPPPTVEEPPPVTMKTLREANAAKLRELAVGINEYVSANGVYPPYGKNLSWRVELLPFLGYGALYRKFHHDEPWDSEHNMSLIGEMPAEYRVAGDPDDAFTSGFELLGGDPTIFASRIQALMPKQVSDGIENTILLVQIDKPYRIRPWIAPSVVTIDETRVQLSGSTEADPLFLMMWADGRVTAMDRAVVSSPEFAAAGTANGGERVSLTGTVLGGALIQGPRPTAVAQASGTTLEEPGEVTSASGEAPIDVVAPTTPAAPADPRLPVPASKDQRAAQEVVRELFLKRYQSASNQRDRQKIAAEIFEKSQHMGDDVPGEFAMVTTAIKIALESNDVETAGKAVQHLVDRFQFDAYDMKVSLLRKTEKLSTATAFDTTILDDAIGLVKEAVKRDEYDVAKEMADVAQSAARRLNHKETAADLSRVKEELTRMSAAYDGVQAALAQVSDPSKDAVVSEKAGKFYCFFKGEWDRGLPYLARSADPQLRGLSQTDLEAPSDHDKQIRLADGWFELAERLRSPEDQHVRRRSLFWYESAHAGLPDGLNRLKAEVRINEIKGQLANSR